MSPELRFIFACCRWPDDAERRALVHSAADAVSNWQSALTFAEAHRVEGLVAQAVEASGIGLPTELQPTLEQWRQDVRAAALKQVGETLRVSQQLAVGGIVHRIVKGVPLGIQAYGTPTLKHSWDIDLLVEPSDTVAAFELLQHLGYRPEPPVRHFDRAAFERWAVTTKELILEAPGGHVVELHWRISDHPMLLKRLSAATAGEEVQIIGSHQVPTFSTAANLAYLAVHGAFHGWSRIKWLADFAALVRAIPPAELDSRIAEARTFQPGLALDQALLLSHRHLGAPQVAVGNQRTSDSLADLAEKVIAARSKDREIEADRSAQRDIRAAQWLILPSARYHVLLALRWVRGSEDRKRFALPKGLGFAYWLMRPFTAAFRVTRRRLKVASRS